MAARTISGRGNSDGAQRISNGPARLRILLVLPAAAALAACSSSGTSAHASGGSTTPATVAAIGLKTTKVGGVTVFTNAKDFTLYLFAPDTPATSKCYGSCAAYWPPVTGLWHDLPASR